MESAFGSIWTRFLLAITVLALCVGAFAQGTSELTGQVTDPTGAVVAGVPVKLTNSATGAVRTSVTSPAGTYHFPALEVVGTYTLEVTPKGFKSVKVQNIVPTVGVIVSRDVRLELGQATEQVTVEAGAQLVQTEDSALGGQVDRRVWQDMPLEDRNSNDFLGLLAGAEPAALAEVADRGPAVNGTRPGSGNFMVDGFNNNDQGTGGGGTVYGTGGSVTTISPDAIEEYRVIDGTPPAEYGKTGGFVTDTVLKSGTNKWHGSLFEYNRIQALAAESFFTNYAGQKDHLIRNQFGGSVGGPIVKDKTFFYFTMEAHRLRTSSPLTANTITNDFLNFVNTGAFATFMESNAGGICEIWTGAPCPGAFSTNAINQDTLAPTSNATLGPQFSAMSTAEGLPYCTTGAANCKNFTGVGQGLWTSPNVIGVPQITYPVNVYAQITEPAGQTTNQMRYATKFDHKLTAKDQLSGSYLYDNADSTFPFGGNNVMGPTELFHGRSQNAGITWSHTFSPTILNQARFSYVRHTGNFPAASSVAGMPSVISYFDSPQIGFGMADNLPQFFTENEFIYKDDVSISHGKHNFKTGAEYSRTRNGSSFDVEENGYIYTMDAEDLVTDGTFTNNWENYYFGGQYFGGLAIAGASLNPTTNLRPEYYRGFRANEVAAYLQDDWRVSSRLTVNMGVRWEYFGPPHNYQAGLDANFYTGTPVPVANPGNNPFYPATVPGFYASIASGAVQQRNHDLWNKDLNNFGPRLGFSYDALGNQKMVIRGGFGVNYDRMYNNVFENIRFNPPYFALGLKASPLFGFPGISEGETSTVYQRTWTAAGTASFGGAGLTPSIRAMDQNLVTPYYEQAHLGVQYQLGKDFVLESNYVGTFGHKLEGILGEATYDGRTIGGGYSGNLVNPNYGRISFRTNCCSSNYHGFQTTLRKRFSSGLQFNANYTYSKAMDDISDTLSGKISGASNAYPSDSMNPSFDYGPADFNVKSRVVGSFVYDLPFAKSNRWLGGWNISGIVSWQTGAPFSVIDSGVDSNKDGQFSDRAVYIGPGSIGSAINHNQKPWLGYLNSGPSNWGVLNGSTTAHVTGIACPVSVNMGLWCEGKALGQMERNTLTGPGFFNTDLGVKKSFKITEATSLRLEANFFNIWNHPNFQIPDNNINDGGAFGLSTATFNNSQTGGPRITQLAVRFDF
ncbi:MAG: TonB-dependent receptor [Terriglobales bacterium]|jgi:hypothetical protein